MSAENFSRNIETFVRGTICAETIPSEDYVEGKDPIAVAPSLSHNVLNEGQTYEEQLEKLLVPSVGQPFAAIIGGLGSGKTTAVQHALMNSARKLCSTCCLDHEVAAYVNCIDLEGMEGEAAALSILLRCETEILNCILSRVHGICLSPEGGDVSFATASALRELYIAACIRPRLSAQGVNLSCTVSVDWLTRSILTEGTEDEEAFGNAISSIAEKRDRQKWDVTEAMAPVREDLDSMATYIHALLAEWGKGVIVVDNLDLLVTEAIECVANRLVRLTDTRLPTRVVLLVRPSSVAHPLLAQLENKYMHRAPCSYSLAVRRLSRYVLARSRRSLQTGEDGVACPFEEAPSDEEVEALVLSSFLYACIALAGKSHSNDAPAPNEREYLELTGLHSDWVQLVEDTGVPRLDSVVRIGAALGGIVAQCGRYAVNHMKDYFKSVYYSSALLSIEVRRGMTGGRAWFQYKDLLELIYFERGGALRKQIANIFSPCSTKGRRGLPTLAKIRILRRLSRDRHQRTTVLNIVESLAYYGIPRDVVIDALNYLQERERLCIWMSKNRFLHHDRDDTQTVSISSHGEAHLTNLVYDFEYLWVCQTELPQNKPRSDGFVKRLGLYMQLLRNIGDIEWKQVVFRFSASGVAVGRGMAHEPLVTLDVLYGSASTAIASALAATRHYGGVKLGKFTVELTALISQLARFVYRWERRSAVVNGPCVSFDEFSVQRAALADELGKFSIWVRSHEGQRGRTDLDDLAVFLKTSPKIRDEDSQEAILMPLEGDVIIQIARFGVHLPVLKEFLDGVSTNKRAELYRRRLESDLSKLYGLGGQSLRTYDELVLLVAKAFGAIDEYCGVLQKIKSSSLGDDLVKAESIREFLRERQTELASSAYCCNGETNLRDMDRNKERCNRIISTRESLLKAFTSDGERLVGAEWTGTHGVQ